jgi:hypothetical protein
MQTSGNSVLSSIPFLIYTLIHLATAAVVVMQIQRGRKEKHRAEWMAGHCYLLFLLFCVASDCWRMFIGAYWHDTTLETMPPGGWLIVIAELSHLVIVPLLIHYQVELCIAVKTRKLRMEGADAAAIYNEHLKDNAVCFWVRMLSIVVVMVIAGLQAVNFYGLIGMYRVEGMRRVVEFDIVRYLLPYFEKLSEYGYPSPFPHLGGVIAFALIQIMAGIYIGMKTGWWAYFVIGVIAFLGQGTAPIRPIFFFVSNMFEIFNFASCAWASEQLFRLSPVEVDDKEVAMAKQPSRSEII